MKFYSFSRERVPLKQSSSSTSTSSGGGEVFGEAKEISKSHDVPEEGSSSHNNNTSSSKDEAKSSHPSSGVKRKFSFKSRK
jgi:hypothetical protein